MNKFIERSIKSALNFFKEILSAEHIARSKGLLQSLGPRAKIILLTVLILITCLVKNIPQVAALYILSIILALLSRINIIFFIKRVWIFIPIFTLFIAIPAIFMHNLFSAAIFVLRVATCVSFVVLLTVTTKHNKLLKALSSLGIPEIFVQVLDMSYRYIFLFVRIFEEMHLALKSRLVNGLVIGRAQHWIGGRIASLFRKSIRMSEDVYMAMIARGYNMEKKNGAQ